MAYLIPEYKYPLCPYSISTKNGSMRIGLCWQAKSTDDNWTSKYALTDVYQSNITVDFTVNISRATMAKKKLFSLPNNLDVNVGAWITDYYGTAAWYYTFFVSFNGTELTSAQYDIAGMGTWKNGANTITVPVYELAGEHAVNISFAYAWVCNYYPTANPTENVTQPYDVQLCGFVPVYAAGTNPAPLSDIGGEFTLRDLYLYGNNYNWPPFYTLTTTASSTNTAPCSISNLTTFNTGMRSLGDGTDKNIIRTETNPGPEDDPSGPGGGGGSYDPTSDPIDFPDLPTGGALTSGMIKGFVIGSSALAQLQNKLWDMNFFDITTQFQKLVNQPLDCLISLHCLPVLPSTNSTAEEIKLGSFSTGVNANRITSQYVTMDCGTLNVPEFYGNALDYGPYTKCEIYLPFIGLRSLVIDDVEKSTVSVKYYVDVLTGSVLAFVKCGQSVLYTYTGSCIQHIPATSQTSDLLHNTISAVGPMATGLVTGNPASAAAGAVAGAVNTASAKNHVSRSGDLAGSAGVMGEFCPYMIFHRPRQSLAKNYNKFKGYPSNISYTLGTLSGYTEIEHIHLTGIERATDAELQAIETLLKNGVII